MDPLTIKELLTLSEKTEASFLSDLLTMKLTYGAINGSLRLRQAVAALYEHQTPQNVLITHGAIGANSLLYVTLVEPGDHVIAVLPTYQQHQSIPRCYGANVDVLPLLPENGFLPDLDELRRLVRPATKLIAINNPSGALMDNAFLVELVGIAKAHNIYVLCDEVYRSLDSEGTGYTSSIADLYERGISTGSMSKAYSLAGLRLGWITCNVPSLLEEVVSHRDYNTISVGMVDDYLATLALEHAEAVIARSHHITRTNCEILTAWVAKEPSVSFMRPQSGTTALLKIELSIPSWDFCVRLIEETGVMLVPGVVMNMEAHVRLGYANNTDILR